MPDKVNVKCSQKGFGKPNIVKLTNFFDNCGNKYKQEPISFFNYLHRSDICRANKRKHRLKAYVLLMFN